MWQQHDVVFSKRTSHKCPPYAFQTWGNDSVILIWDKMQNLQGFYYSKLRWTCRFLNFRRNQRRESVRTETRLLEESELYGEQNRYTRDNQKNAFPMSAKPCKVIIPPRGEHDYTCTLPHRGSHPAVTCGYDPRSLKGRGGLDMHPREEGFPPPPEFVMKEHIYETPRFPLQEMPRRVATQSADGICRKTEAEEAGKSNRTS